MCKTVSRGYIIICFCFKGHKCTHNECTHNDVDWLQKGKTAQLMDRGSRLMFYCIPLEFYAMCILEIAQKTVLKYFKIY